MVLATVPKEDELHALLLLCCPRVKMTRPNIRLLATHMGITHAAIYKWIDARKVPPRQVPRLVQLSNGRVTQEQFHPYVFD